MRQGTVRHQRVFTTVVRDELKTAEFKVLREKEVGVLRQSLHSTRTKGGLSWREESSWYVMLL